MGLGDGREPADKPDRLVVSRPSSGSSGLQKKLAESDDCQYEGCVPRLPQISPLAVSILRIVRKYSTA